MRGDIHESLTKPDVTPLPIENLTDEQRRGGACAYCDLPVYAAGAVDLGERRDRDGIRIFPRACPSCADEAAS